MITFIVATLGRPSLQATLRSIETYPGDEILVVGAMTENPCRIVRFIPHGPGGDYGHQERNDVTPLARGQYLAHIDDDDVYVPGTRALMESAIRAAPGKPTIFRMRFPNGITLWENEEIRCGNLGTPCFLIPNRPTMLGTWGSFVGGDCEFLETSKWKAEDYVWRPEVIALLGHNV